MKHYGDIKQINGSDVPPVNVIIGGSPCQDLSVAGKRTGISGERSGLFMEQIRIIKEMRESDEQNGRSAIDARPRYMVWENVPGAFSSNKGQDFKAVLEETVGIVAKNKPDIPIPKGGCHGTPCRLALITQTAFKTRTTSGFSSCHAVCSMNISASEHNGLPNM